MNGLTLRRSKWVMPLMWNKWPEIGKGKCVAHKALQWVKNQDFCMGLQLPSSVSNMNRGRELGKLELMNKCHFRAP